MDARSTAQDVHRCDLCETAIVHSYCDFCHVNLCKPCVVDHIIDGYDKHKIVLFEERGSTLIYPKCGTHPDKICDIQCQDCSNIFVCSFCTASEQHRGHKFEEVTKVYKAKKEAIEKDTERLENIITPKYEEIALDLENQLANLDGGYEKLTTEMSSLGDEWRKEIDNIINKMKIEIKEIKKKHRDVLQKHLNEVKQIQSRIKQTLLATKEIGNSTEVSQTIEHISKVEEFTKLSLMIVTMPKFIPKPIIDREKLNDMFGQITPLSVAREKSIVSLNQPNISLRELLDNPELLSRTRTGQGRLRSISYQNEGRLCTSGWSSCIKCFDNKGSLLQTIETKPGNSPDDVAVDSNGDLIYSHLETRTVNKVKNGQTEELIRLQGWRPVNLCTTCTGDLLVTMYSDNETESKVVRYSGSTEKQTIQFDDEGKPLYSGKAIIKYITENRNHDICVADCGAGTVVVVNQDRKLRWRYTGHPSVTKNESFMPRGITSDSQSRILTSDVGNHCIHILDQDGQFLRYIDNCDLVNPYGLCVDNDDNLFVCEIDKGTVKKIKYLK